SPSRKYRCAHAVAAAPPVLPAVALSSWSVLSCLLFRRSNGVERRERSLHSQHRCIAAHRLAIFQLAHLVAGIDTVVDHGAIELRPRLAVGAQQALDGELRVISQPLGRGEQVFTDSLLDAA